MTKRFINTTRSLFLIIALAWPLCIAHAAEGVTLITQPSAKKGFPIIISEPGSYQLASNLTVASTNVDAITITAGDVTLDLNGFTISGPGSGSGVGIRGGFDVILINGTVRGMGSHGVALGLRSRVEKVRSMFNGGDGFNVDRGSILVGNTANTNGGSGIYFGSESVVTGNAVNVNGAGGLIENVDVPNPNYGSIVTNNVITRNTGVGLNLGSSSGFAANTMVGNSAVPLQGGIEVGGNVCEWITCELWNALP
jgi:hypothetical protein